MTLKKSSRGNVFTVGQQTVTCGCAGLKAVRLNSWEPILPQVMRTSFPNPQQLRIYSYQHLFPLTHWRITSKVHLISPHHRQITNMFLDLPIHQMSFLPIRQLTNMAFLNCRLHLLKRISATPKNVHVQALVGWITEVQSVLLCIMESVKSGKTHLIPHNDILTQDLRETFAAILRTKVSFVIPATPLEQIELGHGVRLSRIPSHFAIFRYAKIALAVLPVLILTHLFVDARRSIKWIIVGL